MADTLRTVAQEAVVRGEQAPGASYKTEHGKQVAGALRAEADKDVFTTLQIAAGEQVSPAILRANIDVAIGILKADGTIDRPVGSAYERRYKRAVRAVKNAEKYFDDQTSFTEFEASTEGKRVIASTGKFLMTHPALAEYFAALPPADRATASKALAEKYLQDPFAREKVRQALLESQLNQGDVADEFSEVARKRDALAAKVTALEAKIKKLEGDSTVTPPVIGEIETVSKRRREFDRIVDPSVVPPVTGTEFALVQTRIAELATLKGDIAAIDNDLRTLRSQETSLQNEQKRMQRILDAGGTPPRDPSDVGLDISAKQGEIVSKLNEKNTKEGEKATKEAEIKAIEDEKKQLDERISEKAKELKAIKDELSGVKSDHGEQVIKLARLEAGKSRAEELAVAEIENIFKKGIEQELTERLERAKEAADKALEESAEKAKDVDEKQYRELRAKRHKTPEGRIDGKAINEDFRAMMRASTEYHITQDPTNPNKVRIVEMPASGWPTTGGPARNEVYYLTGPEIAMINMMNNTNEFGGSFMLGKLKDTEWMQAESQAFAIQTLQDKMYASRKMLPWRRSGVKRLSSAEITKIQNSTWGVGMLEQALEQNKAHIDQLEQVMNGGALKGEILRGPGTWREKIGRMNKAQLALLIMALTAGGAMFGPLLATAAVGTGVAVSGLKLSTAASGLVGAGAGAAAVRARRRP